MKPSWYVNFYPKYYLHVTKTTDGTHLDLKNYIWNVRLKYYTCTEPSQLCTIYIRI